MISAVQWVRRGVARREPVQYELTPEELEALQKSVKAEADYHGAPTSEDEDEDEDDDEDAADVVTGEEQEWEDDDDDEDAMDEDESEGEAARRAVPRRSPAKGKAKGKRSGKGRAGPPAAAAAAAAAPVEIDPAIAKEFDLDHYDDEAADVDERAAVLRMFGGANLRGLRYYNSNEDDPYITLKEEAQSDDEDDALFIEPTDNVLLAAKTEDDISHLEVYVYEGEEDNLFVHHEVLLPSMPLCVAWLDFNKDDVGTTGNLAAVGTFQPEIEIWDLDVIDALHPHAVLGKTDYTDAASVAAKRRAKGPSDDRHTDAVLSIAWNPTHRHTLASASADHTVKLWDLASTRAVRSFAHHRDKVQVVTWNAAEPTVMLTGAYDRTAAVFDIRAPKAVSSWALTADVEAARWNPFAPQYYLLSTEDGLVSCYDGRMAGSASVFTLQAHDEATCALDFNPRIPHCLVTCSFDKTAKVWDVSNQKPSLVHTRDMGMGKLFAVSFCPDHPYSVAVAGGKGKVEVWNTSGLTAVRKRFDARLLDDVPAPPSASAPLDLHTAAAAAASAAGMEDEDESAAGSTKKSKKNKKNKSKK